MFRGTLPFHITSHNTNMEAVINMTKMSFQFYNPHSHIPLCGNCVCALFCMVLEVASTNLFLNSFFNPSIIKSMT